MANSLANIVPQMLVHGLSVLRENVTMPFLVNRAYDSEAAQRGDTVTIPIPNEMVSKTVAPAITAPVAQDVAPTLISIPLSEWEYADFTMTDKDLKEIQNGYLPLQAESAVKALANKVDTDLLLLGDQFYGISGATGQIVDEVKELVDCRKVLNDQLAPIDPRYMVVSAAREAELLSIEAFHNASFGVGGEAILAGDITRRLGFGIAMDQNVPVYTVGNAVGFITDATGYAVGVSTVTVGAVTSGTLLAGDVFTFAGQNQTYVCTADLAGTGALAFAPTLQVAIATSTTAISYAAGFAADHDMDLAFHRDAIAFVTRPLAQDSDAAQLGSIVRSISDPEAKLTLRLEITRQHKQTNWSWDILYGYAVIRRELGCRWIGGIA